MAYDWGYTGSTKQRRALGYPYRTDPAVLEELERIRVKESLRPQVAAIEEQRRQFDISSERSNRALALQEEQMRLNQEAQDRAANSGIVSGLTSTVGTVAAADLIGGGKMTGKAIDAVKSGYNSLTGSGNAVATPTGAQATAPSTGAQTTAVETAAALTAAPALPAATVPAWTANPAVTTGLPTVSTPAWTPVSTSVGTTAVPGAAAPTALGPTGAAGAGAVGGYVGGKLGQSVGEKLGIGGKAERGAVGGALGGAGAAWAMGAMMGTAAGPVGMAVGAAVGAVVGLVSGKSGCIIVTACTDSNSYEVNVARQYRDKFLDRDQLRGYYALAERIVPILEKNARIKSQVKSRLVDRLIDYGEWKLDLKKKKPLIASVIVSKAFLGLCKTVGFVLPEYVRLNGEVY